MKLEGLTELAKILKSMIPSYDDSISELKKTGEPLVTALSTNAPKRTGNLSRSFGIFHSKKRTAIVIGPRYGAGENKGNHAHLVEYGWISRNGVFHKGQPFIRQTYDSAKSSLEANLVKNFDKLMSKKLQ